MASKIWRNLIRTAAVACFVAGSTAQAGGVFYQSDFDPLGFAGSAKWFVDDNCGLGGKGRKMFDKVGIPILGLVENMSIHICSKCGNEEHIFGTGGGEKM